MIKFSHSQMLDIHTPDSEHQICFHHEGGLAMIDVRDDREVAQVLARGGLGHGSRVLGLCFSRRGLELRAGSGDSGFLGGRAARTLAGSALLRKFHMQDRALSRSSP